MDKLSSLAGARLAVGDGMDAKARQELLGKVKEELDALLPDYAIGDEFKTDTLAQSLAERGDLKNLDRETLKGMINEIMKSKDREFRVWDVESPTNRTYRRTPVKGNPFGSQEIGRASCRERG